MNDIPSRVSAMMAEVFAVDGSVIRPDLQFGEIAQWDSIGHINLMLETEIRFGVDVPPDAIAELLSVGKICTFLEGLEGRAQ